MTIRPRSNRAGSLSPRAPQPTPLGHFKDDILDGLADRANVAQFVSFGPGAKPLLRHVRLHELSRDSSFQSVEDSVQALLDRCVEHSANVRSFHPQQPKAHDFLYGLTSVEEIARTVRRLARSGLHTIVNETVDVGDGGVSGVAYAGILEFAPDDTPRCVEKPGTAALPRALALRMLELVYGFSPALDYEDAVRVEFSVHPLKRGVRNQHTIIWEIEQTQPLQLSAEVIWPNRFSRLIGDKAFGLLIADLIGLPVPSTTVVSRRLAPFSFGRAIGSGEYWIRTCPTEQIPGRFTTKRGWLDPFILMTTEDPTGKLIASVIAQEGVDAFHSGAVVAGSDGRPIIEGVAGSGEDFMQGRIPPQDLPQKVLGDVTAVFDAAAEALGPVRLEWAHNGSGPWVLQLHRGATPTAGAVIFPGEPSFEHRFPVKRGLEALRELIDEIAGTGEGVVLVGQVGVTSHFGDVLRRAQIPARVEAPRR